MWGTSASAQLDAAARPRRRVLVALCLPVWLLGACGRIGYDMVGGGAPSDASAADLDVNSADVGSAGPDVSDDGPVSSGSGGAGGGSTGAGGASTGAGGGSTGGGGASTRDSGGVVDGPSTTDQGGVTDAPGGVSDASNCGSGPFDLLHENVKPASPTDALDLEFKLTNRTGQTIPLSSMTLHYYLTNEFTPGRLAVYYTEIYGSTARTGFDASVLLALQPIASPAKPTATSYIDIGFDAGAGMLANGDSLKFEIGLVGATGLETQTNDYSYVAAASGTQQEWDQCPSGPATQKCAKYVSCVTTVYQNGALVWGTPP
jgi:hypothetical protein